MKPHIILYLLVTAFFLIVSCDKNNSTGPEPDPDPDPDTNPNLVSENIGPDGGEITSSDGLLTLTIPQGALGNAETITITPIGADDLGPEFDEIEVEKAYELGPDGLEFEEAITVVFGSTKTPVQDSDTLKFNSEFLFTSSDGNPELLDSLQTIVDFDEGTVSVSGKMNHFSPLVTSQANDGVSFFVFDVPDELEIGQTFVAKAQIFDSFAGSQSDLITLPGPASYEDKSGAPIIPAFSPLIADLPADSVRGFKGSFEYNCNDIGLGIYAGLLSVNISYNFDSGPVNAESFATFRTTVDCIDKPLPKNNLLLSLDGSGSGSVISTPEGIDCPGDCENEFTQGNDVMLDANAAEGSKFVNWTGDFGDNSADDPVITLTMDTERNVTAVFDEIPSYTLTVLKNGDGTGIVISDPQGIDYGDDNTEDYAENTVVTLTATADESSEFRFWSGDIGDNSTSNAVIDLTMDQSRTVMATFGTNVSGGGIEYGLKALPEDMTWLEALLVVKFLDQVLPPGSQNKLDNSFMSQMAEDRLPLLVQGAEGFIVFDLISDELMLDFTNVVGNNTTGLRTPLGALAISRPNPGPDTPSVIASYGQDNAFYTFGFSLYPYDTQNNEYIKGPVSPYPSTVDAFPVGGESISDEVIIVREGGSGINFLRYNSVSDEYLFGPSNESLVSARYGFEQPVTAYGEFVDGPLLVVNIKGDLYFEPRNRLIYSPSVLIGNLGERIIRIRCELPVCVATDFEGNTVRIITWDGETAPSIVGNPVSVGSGPVDPDLYTLPDGRILIAVTGFDDNTISLIEVDSGGNILANTLYEAPQGCENPGHVIIEDNPDDAGNPLIIGSCYETANYFVNDLMNSGGLFTLIGGM